MQSLVIPLMFFINKGHELQAELYTVWNVSLELMHIYQQTILRV